MGTKLDKIKMKTDSPCVNFIGRSNENQGITAEVNLLPDIEPFKAGYMTIALGGALGSCFIQQKEFYTSQNVAVLIPKINLSKKIKQFICTSIFITSQLYYKAFIDELNRHIKTDFKFKLPVDEKGEPDWKYMENYITAIENNNKIKLNFLQTI